MEKYWLQCEGKMPCKKYKISAKSFGRHIIFYGEAYLNYVVHEWYHSFDKLFSTCVKKIIIIINEEFASFQLSGLNCRPSSSKNYKH